jgi:hypothetical protein
MGRRPAVTPGEAVRTRPFDAAPYSGRKLQTGHTGMGSGVFRDGSAYGSAFRSRLLPAALVSSPRHYLDLGQDAFLQAAAFGWGSRGLRFRDLAVILSSRCSACYAQAGFLGCAYAAQAGCRYTELAIRFGALVIWLGTVSVPGRVWQQDNLAHEHSPPMAARTDGRAARP